MLAIGLTLLCGAQLCLGTAYDVSREEAFRQLQQPRMPSSGAHLLTGAFGVMLCAIGMVATLFACLPLRVMQQLLRPAVPVTVNDLATSREYADSL
jgi:hypothetical protein